MRLHMPIGGQPPGKSSRQLCVDLKPSVQL